MARHRLTIGVVLSALAAAYVAACGAFSGTQEDGEAVDAGGSDSPLADAGSKVVDGAIVSADAGAASDAGPSAADGGGFRFCPGPVAVAVPDPSNAGWAAMAANCDTGTQSASTVGGVACDELTCQAGVPAFETYLSPSLSTNSKVDVVLTVAFVSHGTPPHIFVQITPNFVNGQALSFAVSPALITAAIGTSNPPLATWTGLDLTMPATIEAHSNVGSGAQGTLILGVNGDLRSISPPPELGATSVQLQIGPDLPGVGTNNTAADDCYSGVQIWTCN